MMEEQLTRSSKDRQAAAQPCDAQRDPRRSQSGSPALRRRGVQHRRGRARGRRRARLGLRFCPTREALLAAWEERIIEQNASKTRNESARAPGEAGAVRGLGPRTRRQGHGNVRVPRIDLRLSAALREQRCATVRSAVVDRVVGGVASALANAPNRHQLRVERPDVADASSCTWCWTSRASLAHPSIEGGARATPP